MKFPDKTSGKLSSPNIMPTHANPPTPNLSDTSSLSGVPPMHANPQTPNSSTISDNTGDRNFYRLNPYAKPFIPAIFENVTSSPEEMSSDNVLPHTVLQNLRLKNVDKIIIAHININSIRNKIHLLAEMITGRVDILLISETKLDSTFPKPQFFLQGYSEPQRLDRTASGGGLLLYFRSDIPVKPLPLISVGIECIFSEITISKKNGCLLVFTFLISHLYGNIYLLWN